jgi:hypothetical protein
METKIVIGNDENAVLFWTYKMFLKFLNNKFVFGLRDHFSNKIIIIYFIYEKRSCCSYFFSSCFLSFKSQDGVNIYMLYSASYSNIIHWILLVFIH